MQGIHLECVVGCGLVCGQVLDLMVSPDHLNDLIRRESLVQGVLLIPLSNNKLFQLRVLHIK